MSIGQGIILIFLFSLVAYMILNVFDENYTKKCKRYTMKKVYRERRISEKIEELEFKLKLRRGF